jgi:hypothetical protein
MVGNTHQGRSPRRTDDRTSSALYRPKEIGCNFPESDHRDGTSSQRDKEIRMIASFIIQCLSWQDGKPKELDQSVVRVARLPPRAPGPHWQISEIPTTCCCGFRWRSFQRRDLRGPSEEHDLSVSRKGIVTLTRRRALFGPLSQPNRSAQQSSWEMHLRVLRKDALRWWA